MNIGRINSKFLYPLLTSLLFIPTGVMAQATGDFQPVILLNMQSATFQVPCKANVVGPGIIPVQLFDVGQKSSVPVTIDATWTPLADGASGVLEFLSDGKIPQCQSFYSLQISPSQISISLNQGGNVTGLGTAPVQTSINVPFHFQLVESNGVFIVQDPTGQTTYLKASDNTITANPAICFGTDMKGSWSFSSMENQIGGTPPQLPPGVGVSIPDLDQNDQSGSLSKATHVGFPNDNMTINVNFSPMNNPPSPPSPLGHITCHRLYGPSYTADDYGVFVFTDHIGIGKTIQGNFYMQATGPLPAAAKPPLVLNSVLPLQIVVKDNSKDGSVRISAIYQPTNTVIATWVDKGWAPPGTAVPPYSSGFQFGIYTEPGAFDCWDNLVMMPQ